MENFRAVEGGNVFYDLFEFNRERAASPGSGDFTVEVYGITVRVDLDNQKIYVGDEELDLSLPQQLQNVRWILFRRTTVTLPMGTESSKAEKWFGIGFQGSDSDGNNYQRFVFVRPDGSWTLEVKR